MYQADEILFNTVLTMHNIYGETIKKVEQGSRFSVNFQQRSLKIDGKYVIQNGKYEGECGIEQNGHPLEIITQLFVRYHHSLPSERSVSKRKNYFIALPEHKLSDEDMLYGEKREVTQIKLELYVLLAIMTGILKWDDFAKDKWFWQSPEHKDLIILKDWVEPKKEN
ncbi:hypothetical protein [Bacteroides caccae]|uniref:hypothetical protein n=1 Tax=Bacteroides caccae TaxID=47678 RepID=UPI0035655561